MTHSDTNINMHVTKWIKLILFIHLFFLHASLVLKSMFVHTSLSLRLVSHACNFLRNLIT